MNLFPVLRRYWGALMACTYLLLVAGAYWRLWSLEVLGPVPLGLAGLALILLRDFSNYEPELQATTPALVVPAALLAVALFAGGKLVDSTSLTVLGLGVLAVSWLAGIVGRNHLGGLLLLIGLICLPQGLIHDSVLLSLQRLAAGMASWALDVARVPHAQQGTVLEMLRGNLFVEEACSGMRSLLTGLMVAQIYFSWLRRGLLYSLVGLAATALLLLLGNSLRIFVIALLYARYAIDWTSGWRHDMTGMVVYLGVLALLPSLRTLLSAIEAMVYRLTRLFFTWRYPWIVGIGAAPLPEGEQPLKPLAALRLLSSLIPASVCWALLWMAVAGAIELAVFRDWARPATQASVSDLPKLAALELPKELAGWRHDPTEKHVSYVEQYSLDQRMWCFRKGDLQAWVAADMPFDHLHELRICYRARDWNILRDSVAGSPETSPFAVMELRSRENTRLPMLVLFDDYDLTKKKYVGGVPTRLGGRWQMMRARLRGKSRENLAAGKGPFCQVQVVLAGTGTLESRDGEQARQLLDAARKALAECLSKKN